MATKHSSEGFYAFDDPLEAALFSVLIELLKEIEAIKAMETMGALELVESMERR